MDIKIFLTVFVTIFLAELGDKTQLATLLFATDKEVSKGVVFAAAALALVATSAIGVLAGGWVSQHVSERLLKLIAGLGFILIGAWTLLRAA
ncbi:MAG TPA: TMEM165/GDT1 family protein [Nevskiales bacterium]|nr:TMEM165/GDT1 family protein [Nevskiales bacterium]